MRKQRVLFVCIHNSARSQMAEELLRREAGQQYIVESAGIEPGQLNPFAVQALQDIGIDITGKATRAVADCLAAGTVYDIVVTVCDETSAERCPLFPGNSQRLHWGFPDPSALTGSDAHKRERTSAIRDQIHQKIKAWLAGQT